MPKKRTDDTTGKLLTEEPFINDDNEETTYEGSTRYYSFCIVSYATDVDLNDFLNCGVISNYAYILHDKDEQDNHYHILFTTKGNYSCKNLVNLFKECCPSNQNTFCRPISRSEMSCYHYLTHDTDRARNQMKHQYSEDEIVTNNAMRWTNSNESKYISVEEFCTDLFAEDININSMCRKYGRDFMRNIKSYMYCRELEKAERKG